MRLNISLYITHLSVFLIGQAKLQLDSTLITGLTELVCNRDESSEHGALIAWTTELLKVDNDD